MQENKYYQIILMLLYNGVRISEFLNLKRKMSIWMNSILTSSPVRRKMVFERYRLLISFSPSIVHGMNPVRVLPTCCTQRMERSLLTAIIMTATGIH